MDEYFSTCDNYRNQINRSSSVPNVNVGSYNENEGHNDFSNDQPILKRIFLAQELVQNGHLSPRILRQYSYQEIYNSSSALINHTSFVQPSYIKHVNTVGVKPVDQYCTQEEPMEVDTSFDCSNSTNNADMSECKETKFSSNYSTTDDTLYQRKTKPKREGCTSSLLELDKPVRKKQKEVSLLVRFILSVILIIASLSFIVYMVFDYNAYVDLEALENEFALRVYEQKDAVRAILHSLRYYHPHAQWHKPVKILNFIGRSGVGKTLIANIVKLHFNSLFVNDLHRTEVHNVVKHDSIIGNLYSQYMNLIIIDDLNVDDLAPLIYFIEKLEKHDAFVLVIAMFSIQKVDDNLNSKVFYDDILAIHKKFDKTSFYHEVIVFDEFWMADARQYLGKKLDLYNIDVQYHNKVANKVLQDHDIDRHGFKGLYSKVLSEIHQIQHDFL